MIIKVNPTGFMAARATDAVRQESSFLNAIRLRESNNNYQAKNRFGFLGAYQFGEEALIDLGYAVKHGRTKDNKIVWSGKDGIHSETDFLNSHEAQDRAARQWFSLLRKRIKKFGFDKHIGETMGGTRLTESGMLAALHLLGTGSKTRPGLKDFIESGGTRVGTDGNNTPITEYLTRFADIDATEFIPEAPIRPAKTQRKPGNALVSESEIDTGDRLLIPDEVFAEPENDVGFFSEVLPAAFRTENTLVSALQHSSRPEFVEGYEPWEEIQGFEPYADAFTFSRSPQETELIKTRIRRELADRDVLAEAGFSGFVASFIAGAVDPINLIPVGGATYKTYRTGKSVLTGALVTAGSALTSSAASEILLHGSQEARTYGESVMNMAGSVFLGGVLGGFSGYLSSKQIQKAIDDLNLPDGDDPMLPGSVKVSAQEFAEMFSGESGTLSAATNASKLTEEKLVSAFGLEKALMKTAPNLRLAMSPVVSSRRVVQELVEMPLLYEKNALGVKTPVSVENRITGRNAVLGKLFENLDGAYVKYRTGKDQSFFRNRRFETLKNIGGTKNGLTYLEFRREVGKALRRNDAHSVPEIDAAAKDFRKMFDSVKEELIAAKLLPEGVSDKQALPYLTRVYRRDKINKRRGDFKRIIVNWLNEQPETVETKSLPKEEFQEALSRYTDTEVDKPDPKVKKTVAQGIEEFGEETAENMTVFRGHSAKHNVSKTRSFFSTSTDPNEADVFAVARAETDNATAEMAMIEVPKGTKILDVNKVGKSVFDHESEILLPKGTLEKIGTVNKNGRVMTKYRFKAAPKKSQKVADPQLNLLENDDIADQIIDRILKTPVGRIPYEQMELTRGPLKQRTFNIPDTLIEDFLENDIEVIARFYHNTVMPDLELTKTFGNKDLTDTIAEITDDYNRLINKADAKDKSGKLSQTLQKRKANDIRDIEALRDRLRGTYAIPDNPDGFIPRASLFVRQFNYITKLGGMTVSSVTDIARVVQSEGIMRTFGNGLRPLIEDFQALKLSADEVKLAGVGYDMVLNSRVASLAHIADEFGVHTPLERGMTALSTDFGNVSLMNPWNAAMKQFTGVISQSRILEATDAWAKGKISKTDLQKLASSGIDEELARRIQAMFKEFGETRSGARIAHSEDWTDVAATDAFRSALRQDVERAIITPSKGESPLWTSHLLGRHIFQFKSFATSATQRVLLAGLQRPDANYLIGSALGVALGMGVFYTKMKLAGAALPDDWRQWVLNGVDRSGQLGWFFEADNVLEKATRGNYSTRALTGSPPLTRYSQRDILTALLGPTASSVIDLTNTLGATASGEWSERDAKAFRRLLPYQNLFYARIVFDEAQAKFQETVGAN